MIDCKVIDHHNDNFKEVQDNTRKKVSQYIFNITVFFVIDELLENYLACTLKYMHIYNL